MFDRMVGDWRRAAAAGMGQMAIALAAGLAAAATLIMLCAAVFVSVMQRFGVINACLAVAGIFLVLTLALIALYGAGRRRAERAAAEASATQRSLLYDPLVMATGLQIVQAVGVKRALTLAPVAGTALALASRPAARPARVTLKAP